MLEHLEPKGAVTRAENVEFLEDFARKLDTAKAAGCDDATIARGELRKIETASPVVRCVLCEVLGRVAGVAPVIEQTSSREDKSRTTDCSNRDALLHELAQHRVQASPWIRAFP